MPLIFQSRVKPNAPYCWQRWYTPHLMGDVLKWAIWFGLVLCGFAATPSAGAAPGWIPQHTVIVILENKSAHQILGRKEAPYLNALAQSAAYMTQAYFAEIPYGIIPKGTSSFLPARPSQPNYLYLFSGNNQGVLPNWFHAVRSPYKGTATRDQLGNALGVALRDTSIGIGNKLIPPGMRPFTTPNLGAAIMNAGRTFASFSESLPYPHYDEPFDFGGTENSPDLYRRKHNPTINWINTTDRSLRSDEARFVLPISVNLGFTNTHDPVDGKHYRGFAVDARGNPIGHDQLPIVSIVVPNEQHNAHSGSIAAADAWLRTYIKPYAEWARTHGSLLIVTCDEDGGTDASRGDSDQTGHDAIFTLFYGPRDKVIPGHYAERVDHLNVLSTVLDRYGVLEQFKVDFAEAYPRSTETRAEFANLRPIRDIFGEGLPLRGR